MKSVACVLLLGVLGAVQAATVMKNTELTPCGESACAFDNVKCVGLGAYCTKDASGGTCTTSTSRSACYQCSDPNNICHDNKCIAGVGEGVPCCPDQTTSTCDPAVQHSFCTPDLQCQNASGFGFPRRGTCNSSQTLYLAPGEACDPNDVTQICYPGANLQCDPTSRSCTYFNSISAVFQAGYCESNDDCKAGFYCPITAAPGAPASCVAAYPTNGATLNKPCHPANQSQCGYVMLCQADNAMETDTDYQTYKCQNPYSRSADDACSGDEECGGGTICTNGWCTPVQGDCLGRRCTTVSDCIGNKGTMSCGCPPSNVGGGYTRCLASSSYQAQWSNKYQWDNYLRDFFQCLANNNCPITNNGQGFKCTQTYCQAYIDRETKAIQKCYNSVPLWGRSYPSPASAAVPTVSVAAALLTAIAFFQH